MDKHIQNVSIQSDNGEIVNIENNEDYNPNTRDVEVVNIDHNANHRQRKIRR